MALNPDYMIAPSLQSYFVDKTTGLPLAGGIVNFYSDVNRANPKTVYTISGSAPNYTYAPIGSSITLSSVGTTQDNAGNDILIYYYPFDNLGNVELYYIEVFDSDGVPQFTRQAFPNFVSESSNLQDLGMTNYIPNGQFLSHNNIPSDTLNNLVEGQITSPITYIAQGGWNFARNSSSVANDNVTFFRYGSFVTNPSSSPRYAVICQCFNPDNTDTFKGLRIRFNDVNKFASATQEYTFAFSAAVYNSANFNVRIDLIKFFGTGGTPSATTTQTLNVFTLNLTQTIYQISFVFGDNLGKQIGTNNDDYVELSISFPTNLSFGAQITDAMLFLGATVVTGFPTQTDSDFMARSLTAPPPDPNGGSLGLPLILTKQGLNYDNSLVGMIIPYSSNIIPSGFIRCNGSNTIYTNGYFFDGVPARRLYNVLYNGNTLGMSVFGTGIAYVTSIYFNNLNGNLIITTNSPGAQTLTNDGNTGFTFLSNITGAPSNQARGYVYGNGNNFWIINGGVGTNTGFNNAGTSGFSINSTPDPNIGERIGTNETYQVLRVLVSAVPAAGSYFRFSTPSTQFYVWYQINGAGADPAPGGTGIRVNLSSLMTLYDVAFVTAHAISGHQISSILSIPSGGSIIPNSYFNFYANGKRYYVWFNLNGSGTDPSIAGAIGIPVVYNTSYTQNDMTRAVVTSINSQYFTTPDLTGRYIKGYDDGNPFNDYNIGYRYANNSFTFNSLNLSQYIGSLGLNQVVSHNHNLVNLNSDVNAGSFPIARVIPNNNDGFFTGIAQNDVENVYLNYIMKY